MLTSRPRVFSLRPVSRSVGTCVAVSILAVLLSAGSEAAAQDGVHVDPESPAGKEYALPLDAARRAASGAAASDAPRRGSAPLFGTGISSGVAAPPDGTSGAEDASSESAGRDAEAASGGEAARGAAGHPASRPARAAADTGFAPRLLATLIALGIVAVGACVGLSAKSMRRRNPSG